MKNNSNTIFKVLAFALALAAAHGLFADTCTANGVTWTYRVVNGEADISDSYRSPAIPQSTTGALEIPSTLNGYRVTSIGDYAFYECSGLTSVTIPNSVTSIGHEAFYDCSGLTSVTIPNSVTSIGGWAFDNCSGLTSVTIGNSVTSIGDCAFQSCSGLTSVTIPDSVTSIGKWAFNNCRGLTSVTIPDSVTSIGDSAFRYCSGLTSVTIPDSVTSIGDSAFRDCSGLTSVTIPDSVTSIGSSAFFSCSGLTSVTIGNSVTSIGYSAFYQCTNLTSVTIPDSVTSIGGSAFYGCRGLTSVTIGNSVTSIGNYAFAGCSGLKLVTMKGPMPVGFGNSELDNYGITYPRQYGGEYSKVVPVSKFAGWYSDSGAVATVVSSKISEDDPTIMDVIYKVTSNKKKVKVRALAFEDGERSFAKVVRPVTFIEGTAVNIGDEIDANVEHTLSCKVDEDYVERLAKLKFEILASEGDLVQLELRTIPKSERYGKMQIS